MDPSSFHLSATELYELIGVVGGLGVTGTLGVLFVRRARASRRRQIDEAGDGPPALGRAEERSAKPPRTREWEPEPESRGRQRGGAAPARAPEPRHLPPPAPETERAAHVIPFPAPAPEPQPEPAPKKRANALVPGLARTRSGFVARLGAVFTGRKQIDPAVVDEIEKVLLTADIGVKTSQKLLEEIRSSLSRSELKDPDAVWAFLRQRSTEMLSLPAPDVDFGSAKPFVLLVIGVNGSGKTTTIGKLAARLAGDGKKVLMAAGDTFRAAAAEQLEVWAGRTGAAIVRGKEGADPSSVIFDGIKKAATEGFDVAIADTAGRLHTKTDLMQELQKVRRVVGKAALGAPHETWLVIDSTSGQNAIAQAQIFTEAMAVSGIVLTKLDGTAKGGVILGIADQLKIPVRYIGIGETVEDLRPFDPAEFVEALFAPLES
ncbi:MAG TPA: signal recognition particle-docking protein FtsY [Polyangia bacterium]|nr:signal recognition particle-docking protein FtsY [Polyangia bacterium]